MFLDEQPIRAVVRGAVLEVTLDRPKANAIDLATSRIMGQVFKAFRDDPDLRDILHLRPPFGTVRTVGQRHQTHRHIPSPDGQNDLGGRSELHHIGIQAKLGICEPQRHAVFLDRAKADGEVTLQTG